MALSHPPLHSPGSEESLGVPPILIRILAKGDPWIWMGIRFFACGWSLFWRSPRLQLWGSLLTLTTAATFAGLVFSGAWLTGHGLEALAFPLWLLGLAPGLMTLVIVLGLTYSLLFPLVTPVAGPFREQLAAHTQQHGQAKRGNWAYGWG